MAYFDIRMTSENIVKFKIKPTMFKFFINIHSNRYKNANFTFKFLSKKNLFLITRFLSSFSNTFI
jgi:hypothetical protein